MISYDVMISYDITLPFPTHKSCTQLTEMHDIYKYVHKHKHTSKIARAKAHKHTSKHVRTVSNTG